MLESYSRSYDDILKLQHLFEMEEIIEIKKFKQIIDKQKIYEVQQDLQQQFEAKKKKLIEIWEDRLMGCQQNTTVWEKTLAIHSLLVNKKENMKSWLKFIRLTVKSGQMQICKRTLDNLKKELNPNAKNDFDYPPSLVIQNLECQYLMNQIQDEQIQSKMNEFLNISRQDIDNNIKSEGYYKLGQLIYNKVEEMTFSSAKNLSEIYLKSLQYCPTYGKAWHMYGLMNYQTVSMLENQNEENETKSICQLEAVKGFIKAISYGEKDALQDNLRLLSLIFKYGDNEQIYQEFQQNFESIDIISWIQVIPQIIARIDIPKSKIRNLLNDLLIHVSRHHPQALVYQLTVAAKNKNKLRKNAALKILDDIKQHSPTLVQQSIMISEELIRVAILLKEMWHEDIELAWKAYNQDKNIDQVLNILIPLHERMSEQPLSISEITFYQQFGQELKEAEAWLKAYMMSQNTNCLNQAFDLYYQCYKRIDVKLQSLKVIHLENVSPQLLQINNCQLAIPGLYKPNKKIVTIAAFDPQLSVMKTKQQPRRLLIYGSDSKEYHFLLKGHEDLRQDERVMQLFSLVNRLLSNDNDTEKKDLNITRYSVIPLSINTGLIGWIQDCDTLQQLIKGYRDSHNIRASTETALMYNMCQNYDSLPLANKVEIFRFIQENTKGEDLQKVIWLSSANCEIWLERRTTYTRSLATMSMVGYILGLGDRHPSNIMLQRKSGRVVHIDFGDCWEVAMKRDKFPEKVPFRLTRMLIKAMEGSGIEGNYRNSCEIVMKVLRENRESLMAVLEAFIYDPLLNWRLLPQAIQGNNENSAQTSQTLQKQFTLQFDQNIDQGLQALKDKYDLLNQISSFQDEIKKQNQGEDSQQPENILNIRALQAVEVIRRKLVGRDFNEEVSLKVVDQVNKLIRQATSHENICQAWLGWCPFW